MNRYSHGISIKVDVLVLTQFDSIIPNLINNTRYIIH